MHPRSRLFCFGMGYTARTLARALSAEGWQIAGTSRSAGSQGSFSEEGIALAVFDGTAPLVDAGPTLAGTTHVLISIPPGAAGDPVLAHHAADIAALDGLRWAGYLSTTGVYGDHGGAWVDETTALAPTSERSRRRVVAEQDWLALWRERGVPVHIFRLAGIYGPGRSVLDSLRAGTAKRIDKPGQVFSRIHVDDIVQALQASMAQPDPGAVYNLCDDDPAPPADVVEFAAELLEVEPPPLLPFAEAQLSPMAESFYRDSKRVRNERIKAELGIRLKYPDYKSGFRAILAIESG